MRIERLEHENRRTQGLAQRALYQRLCPEHLRAVSHLLDCALAELPPHPRIAILGAGACTEIPLERLVPLARAIVLVDLDAAGMAEAITAVAHSEIGQSGDGRTLRRPTAVTADLTGGVSARLAARLDTLPWEAGQPPAEVLAAVAGALDATTVPDPSSAGPPATAGDGTLPSPGRFDLVISAIVLTQLFSLPLLDIVDRLHHIDPQLPLARDDDPVYQAAANRFRRRVALAHLHLLRALLAPGGVAIFLTDVVGHLLAPNSAIRPGQPLSPDLPKLASLTVLPSAVLALPADLLTDFSLVGVPRAWQGLAQAPQRGQPGRIFDLWGAVLRPLR